MTGAAAVKLCPASGKRSYGSPGAARRAMAKAHQRIRVYRCIDCGLFHVTKERFR